MHRPVVGRTTSQSSWHQIWNDRLRGKATPCQYRAGKVEAALRHRRKWAAEMPVLAELLSQAAWVKGVRSREQKWTDNAWPGADEALPCLGGSLQLSGEKGQLLLPCYGCGTNWVAVNSTELHVRLNCLRSEWTCTLGKWLLLSESNFLEADPRHGTNSSQGEYLCFLTPLRNWAWI